MSVAERVRLAYWTHFSKPSQHRPIYREISAHRILRILEIGLGTGERARRMIEVARLASPGEEVSYVGIDLFEDRTAAAGPGHSLKAAYRLFRGSGTRVQLIPGDPFAALARTANALGHFDLILASRWPTRDTMSAAWYYIPRLLHAGTSVFLEQADATVARLRRLTTLEINRLATPPRARCAA